MCVCVCGGGGGGGGGGALRLRTARRVHGRYQLGNLPHVHVYLSDKRGPCSQCQHDVLYPQMARISLPPDEMLGRGLGTRLVATAKCAFRVWERD